ncbi:MAG: carotenoid biosynthesis protein, partial [Planctomycetes bacterium]|nr:carotenoid biosynthesis protein [Planctomycetota bacterium]
FLAYASYAMALFFRLNHVWRGGPLDLENDPAVRQGPSVLLLSALFMTWLDIVIDPLAVRGHEWFLGKIFWYEDPGWFYGVPVSNFLGWFFVALVIVGLFQRCDALFDSLEPAEDGGVGARRPARVLLGCGLWWGVLLFNLGIALWTSDVRRPETMSFLITAILLHVPIFFFFVLRLAGGVALAGGRGFDDT